MVMTSSTLVCVFVNEERWEPINYIGSRAEQAGGCLPMSERSKRTTAGDQTICLPLAEGQDYNALVKDTKAFPCICGQTDRGASRTVS
jgi:hypothetical protein